MNKLFKTSFLIVFMLLFSCLATAQVDWGDDDVNDEAEPPVTPIDNSITYGVASALLIGFYFFNKNKIQPNSKPSKQ